jgi:rhodanese-related sulfurtransferase
MEHAPRFLRLCEDTRQNIRELTAEEYSAQQAERSSGGQPLLQLVDVREDHEWQAGYIPGARHLGRGILERDIERTFADPATPLVLYCGGGFRSALAADSLSRMGYTNVFSLAGGFRGWKDSGRKIESAPESPPKESP